MALVADRVRGALWVSLGAERNLQMTELWQRPGFLSLGAGDAGCGLPGDACTLVSKECTTCDRQYCELRLAGRVVVGRCCCSPGGGGGARLAAAPLPSHPPVRLPVRIPPSLPTPPPPHHSLDPSEIALLLHWNRYYSTAALKRDFGVITAYQAPKTIHPGSIMSVSNTGGHGRGGQVGADP